MTRAERARIYRARRRRCRCCLLIEIDEPVVVDAVVRIGLLSLHEADNREKITMAVEKLIVAACATIERNAERNA